MSTRETINTELIQLRLELSELIKQRDGILAKEDTIYQDELTRIKAKQQLDATDIKKEHEECLAEYINLIHQKTKRLEDQAQLHQMLEVGRSSTIDRREEYRRAIQQKNALDYARRNEGKQDETRIQEIDKLLEEINTYLAQYPEFKRQINEDYYNWSVDYTKTTNELEQLTQLLLDLTNIGRPTNTRLINNQLRLQRLLADLKQDIRQNPTARYRELETTADQQLSRKRALENKRAILTKVMASRKKLGRSALTGKQVGVPDFFREEVQNYKRLKCAVDTCKTDLAELDTRIQDLHGSLQHLTTKCKNRDYMCPELQTQLTRAKDRKFRIAERLKLEYGEKIQKYQSRIRQLETELEKCQNVTTDNTPANFAATIISNQESTPSVYGNKPTDGHGKSKREMKLEQMRLAVQPVV